MDKVELRWKEKKENKNTVGMYFLLVFQFVQIAGHILLGLLCLDLTDIKLKFFAFKNITITASALARS